MLLLLVALACSPSWDPTPTRTIDIRPTCGECSLALVKEAVIGTDSGGPRPIMTSGVVKVGDRYAVAPVSSRGVVAFFDRDARFTDSIRPRLADHHPQATVEVHGAAANGDIYLLADSSLVVLSSSRSQREIRLPFVPSRMVLGDRGEIVAAAHLRTPDHAGMPLHVISPSGKHIQAFGSFDGALALGSEERLQRVLARSRSGDVWAGDPYSRVVEQYDFRGRLKHRFIRPDDSERIHDDGQGVEGARELTKTKLVALVEDEDGRLWMLTQRLKPTALDLLPSLQGLRDVVDRQQQLYETVIEVLDPERGRLVASVRCDGMLSHFAESRTIAGMRVGPGDQWLIELWSPQLSRLSTARRQHARDAASDIRQCDPHRGFIADRFREESRIGQERLWSVSLQDPYSHWSSLPLVYQ